MSIKYYRNILANIHISFSKMHTRLKLCQPINPLYNAHKLLAFISSILLSSSFVYLSLCVRRFSFRLIFFCARNSRMTNNYGTCKCKCCGLMQCPIVHAEITTVRFFFRVQFISYIAIASLQHSKQSVLI